ncbi:MAG: asparagine synthase (glutamine-hydrolyzing) [Bacteroidia bacterium]
MCGINGIYGINNSEEALAKLKQMNTALAHRGPDDEGVFLNNEIALGHRRLSIIDLSAAGHQPMTSHDGRYTIVYNGELYNYKNIKLDLQRVTRDNTDEISSFVFRTNTDTEVILAAYIRWGKACLQQFNGMFAFAIWDNLKKELFIARDRLGIKPLYYFQKNNLFLFSSELRALLSSECIPRKIDQNSLVDYLRYQTVHAPSTIVENVKMLLPGHCMKITNTEIEIENYWKLIPKNYDTSKEKKYEHICKDVKKLLGDAVERRLVADVPFGAFLSGGIDSSAIVALMSQVSSKKIKTFSVTFDESEFSEAKYAQLIAKKYDTDHHEIKLKPIDFIEDLPDALKAMDHPSGDGPNTFVVSKATKNAGITMALSGLGGDELFAGYPVFKQWMELKSKFWLNMIPPFARNLGGTILTNIKPSVASEKKAALLKNEVIDFNAFYSLSRQTLLDNQLNILRSENLPANSVSEFLKKQKIANIKSEISKVSVAEISTYMQNVLLRDTDQMSMANALEVRVPFLDHTLVEYVLMLSDKSKFPITPKKLLTDSLGDLLPPEIINRPKMGFTFPWKHWLKNELNSFCEQRIIALSKRIFFNEKEVIQLWKDFLKDNPRVTWSRIWHLVVLENWLQENNIE